MWNIRNVSHVQFLTATALKWVVCHGDWVAIGKKYDKQHSFHSNFLNFKLCIAMIKSNSNINEHFCENLNLPDGLFDLERLSGVAGVVGVDIFENWPQKNHFDLGLNHL